MIETRKLPPLNATRLNIDLDYNTQVSDAQLEDEDAAELASPATDLAIMALADGRIFRQKLGTTLSDRRFVSTISALEERSQVSADDRDTDKTKSEGAVDLGH